jgi:hypothetical protein
MHDLKPREREALFLKGVVFSYTAVNRRITEGRARLRQRVDSVAPTPRRALMTSAIRGTGAESEPDPA